MIIHLYALFWNEEKMLPFFFRHYDSVVDKFCLLNNHSTDYSLKIIEDHTRVENAQLVRNDNSLDHLIVFLNEIWKKSRNIADWVIICDIDEHIYHPGLLGYLQKCQSQGITIIKAIGYQMISQTFPKQNDCLIDTLQFGSRDKMMDKICIFNPNAISEINYKTGKHTADPKGHIVYPNKAEIKLLHYKYLGQEYVMQRYLELKEFMNDPDKAKGYGAHYAWDYNKIQEVMANLEARSVNVIKKSNKNIVKNIKDCLKKLSLMN